MDNSQTRKEKREEGGREVVTFMFTEHYLLHKSYLGNNISVQSHERNTEHQRKS
jgi:hypothetical protein